MARVRSPGAGGFVNVPMLMPPRASAIWVFVAMVLASDTGARVLMTNSSPVSTRSSRVPARYRLPAVPVTMISFRPAAIVVVPRLSRARKSAAFWGVISFGPKTFCSPRADCLLVLVELAWQPVRTIAMKTQKTIHPACFAPQLVIRFTIRTSRLLCRFALARHGKSAAFGYNQGFLAPRTQRTPRRPDENMLEPLRPLRLCERPLPDRSIPAGDLDTVRACRNWR